MPDSPVHDPSGNDYHLKWVALRRNHELLAAKRIDAEDGRRELDEYKNYLATRVETLRERCLVVQSRSLSSVGTEQLLQATHDFMKAQERLAHKEQRHNQEMAEIIQLEGRATELGFEVFGEAPERTFKAMQQYLQSILMHDMEHAVHEDREMTVTEATDHEDEWDPASSPFTELLSRLEAIESQILPPRSSQNPEIGSHESPKRVAPGAHSLMSGKPVKGLSPHVQPNSSDICRDWNAVSRQLYQCQLVGGLPNTDEVPARTPEALPAKAKSLVQGLYCRPNGIVEIDVRDVERIRSNVLSEPAALSKLLNLDRAKEDIGSLQMKAVAAYHPVNTWLLDQLVGSEENLDIYARILFKTPELLKTKIPTLRRLIHDNWHIDGTELPTKSTSVHFETTHQRSRQAQPDINHSSGDIEPFGEPSYIP